MHTRRLWDFSDKSGASDKGEQGRGASVVGLFSLLGTKAMRE